MASMAYFEIHADDLEACARFYADIFGWTTEKMSDEHWHLDTGNVTGLVFHRRGSPPPQGSPLNAFVCTFGTDNLDSAWSRALARGASGFKSKFSAPGGTAAYLTDPFGNLFGLYEEAGGG